MGTFERMGCSLGKLPIGILMRPERGKSCPLYLTDEETDTGCPELASPNYNGSRFLWFLHIPHFLFRAYLLQNFNEEGSTEKPSQEKLHGFAAVLAIGSSRCKANTLGKRAFA